MEQVTDAMDTAIQTLIDTIQSKQKEITELKRTTNSLCRHSGKPEVFTDVEDDTHSIGNVRVRADEFYGKSVLTAARMYLEKRKQAASAADVLKALQDGGFDFSTLDWDSSNLLRPLSMSMSKNTAIFHRLPNGMWGLAMWYPDAVSKKKGKKSAEADDEEETAAE